MEQELRNEDVWRQCGFERPPSRQTLDRFITDFVVIAEEVFIRLVHELAEQVPLGKLFRIDGTDIPVSQRDEDAQWNAITLTMTSIMAMDACSDRSKQHSDCSSVHVREEG